mgnify:CR=1 FL=1
MTTPEERALGFRAEITVPSNSIVPASGARCTTDQVESKVDLPDPLRPTIATNSRSLISALAPSSTGAGSPSRSAGHGAQLEHIPSISVERALIVPDPRHKAEQRYSSPGGSPIWLMHRAWRYT